MIVALASVVPITAPLALVNCRKNTDVAEALAACSNSTETCAVV